MKTRLFPALLVLALTSVPSRSDATDFYVSPSGLRTNAGTKTSPWDLATALAQPSAVRPGDTIWLRGGVYAGPFVSNLTGTAALPIVVRQYPGELATIDGVASPGTNTLVVNGSDTWYWGFEITNSEPTRVYVTTGDPSTRRGEGIYVLGSRTKFINLLVHDTQDGIGLWNPAQDTEVYGALIYNNGHVDPVRGEGHGIYIQNQTGTKSVRDVVSFNNFATGMKAFGETGYAIGVAFDGVISFNNGSPAAFTGSPAGYDVNHREANLFVGTAVNPADRISVTGSMLYHEPGVTAEFGNLNFGYVSVDNVGLVCTNNYVAGGQAALSVKSWRNVTFSGNTLYASTQATGGADEVMAAVAQGSSPTYSWNGNAYFDDTHAQDNQRYSYVYNNVLNQFGNPRLTYPQFASASGFDATSTYATGRPTGTRVFVRPNAYEPGRANVAVFNWALAATADVDLSGVLVAGDAFEVRNAQNFFAPPVVTGTYSGAPVRLPLTGLSAAAPIGRPAAAATGPEFNAFVVRRTSAAPACTYALGAPSGSAPGGGGSGSVSVTAGAGCAWTATSAAPWVSITAGANGTGNGTVTYAAAANPTCAGRSTTLTIAGLAYSVTQAAGSSTASLSPTAATTTAGAGGGTIAVTIGASCPWTAVSNVPWITISSGASGTGNGTVTYAVASQTGCSRTGTITIGGATFTVTQAAGSGCATGYYTLGPCRSIDTRKAVGPLGGPALAPNQKRVFPVSSSCGIPAGATALAVNATAVHPSAPGFLHLYPGNLQPTSATVLGYRTGRDRATTAIIQLATDGSGSFGAWNESAGSTDFVLDVVGYFK